MTINEIFKMQLDLIAMDDMNFIAHLLGEICDYSIRNGLPVKHCIEATCKTILNILEMSIQYERDRHMEEQE